MTTPAKEIRTKMPFNSWISLFKNITPIKYTKIVVVLLRTEDEATEVAERP
jgi:hypothetical protein